MKINKRTQPETEDRDILGLETEDRDILGLHVETEDRDILELHVQKAVIS